MIFIESVAESALLSDFSESTTSAEDRFDCISEGYSATLMSEVVNHFSQQHPNFLNERERKPVQRVAEGEHIGLAYLHAFYRCSINSLGSPTGMRSNAPRPPPNQLLPSHWTIFSNIHWG